MATREYYRQWHHQHKDQRNAERRKGGKHSRAVFSWHLRRSYGLSLEEYDSLVLLQEGRCALCESPALLLWVDHNHDTQKVRGLLCPSCNSGLGFLREHPDLLRRAVQYLK